jgi:hypothetical protein
MLAPSVLGGACRLDAPTAFAYMDPPTPWLTWAMALYVAEDALSDRGEGQQGCAASAPQLLADDRRWLPHLGASEWISRVSSPATNRSGKTLKKGAENLANSRAALQISLMIR